MQITVTAGGRFELSCTGIGRTAVAGAPSRAAGGRAGPGSWVPVPRFLIRSAGFPFRLTELGADDLDAALRERAGAAEELDQVRREWASAFGDLVAERERRAAGRDEFRALYRANRAVTAGNPVPDGIVAQLAGVPALPAWNRATARRERAGRELAAAVRRADDRAGRTLRDLLRDDAVRAAVAASNPGAAARLAASLDGDRTARRSSTRQDERTFYAYLQRLSTKNETTSFFGPVDYGHLGGPRTRLRYADRPVQARHTRLAHWAVQAFADRVAADPDVAGHLPLRLRDGLTPPDGGALAVAASGRRIRLSAPQAAVLDRVLTGGRTLASLPGPDAAALLERGVLTRVPLVPTALDDPAGWLRDLLEDVVRAGCDAARPWRDRFGELTGLVARMSMRAPDAIGLLEDAERRFGRDTGGDPRRGAGAHYADRLLVTEDCRGAVAECVVSDADTAVLVGRLTPVLELCASYSLVVQRAVTGRARAVLAGLGDGPVGYLRLAAELDSGTGMAELLDAPDVRAWRARFDDVVTAHLRDRDRTSVIPPGALAALYEDVPAGITVSPDVFLGAAPGGADPATTDLVVGEIHHGTQVWTHLSVLDPDPAGTRRAVAGLDDGTPATLLCRRTQGKAFERELPGPVVAFRAAVAEPHERVLPAESLTVRAAGAGLQLTDPGGRPVRLRPRHPRSPSNWLFGPPPVIAPTPWADRSWAPRVTVGDVVAWRRCWRPDADALAPLTGARDAVARVTAAADLRAALGLPRRVFVRARDARKPVFADLQCPAGLAHLAHHLRGAPSAHVSEMLPEPDGWWLRPAGEPVSCEWRLTLGRTGDGAGAC